MLKEGCDRYPGLDKILIISHPNLCKSKLDQTNKCEKVPNGATIRKNPIGLSVEISFSESGQYFTMPHWFLQEWTHSTGIHRSPQEWHRNPQEWAGIHRNGTGMALEWTKIDILEVFTLPGLFRMESIWNQWNQCWLRPQPISYSMDILDSMWNDDGMVMEWLIPYGIHMDSTEFHMECRHIHLGFHGTSPYGFHGTSSYGFHDHCTIRTHINSTRDYWIDTE